MSEEIQRLQEDTRLMQATLSNHRFRIDAHEIEIEKLNKSVDSNFCTVCKKIDALTSTVNRIDIERKSEEKHAGKMFDRWLPLLLGLVSLGIAAYKMQ